MKIIHFDLAAGFRGGQRQALLLHRNLRQLGIDSLLAVDARGRLRAKAEADGIGGVLPLDLKTARSTTISRLLSLPRVWSMLRRERPDIVHFHEPASLLYRPFAGRALTVETRRVSFPIKPLSVRLKYRPIDLHVGVSDEITDYLRSFGLEHVHTVRSAIDVARFEREPAQRPLAGRPGFKLLYVGAFHKMKGIDVLLAAFRRLAAADASIELHLVGDGELLDGFRGELGALGLADRAVFHGYREDTEVFYADADAVLITSTYGEGSNGIIKEATAAGVPVIASDLACNAELIAHGIDGLLFRNGDADDLAARVAELRRGDLRFDPQRLRARAREWSDEQMSARYLDLYRRHLGDPRKA